MFKRNMYFALFIVFLLLLPSIFFSISGIIMKYSGNIVFANNIDKELKNFFTKDLLVNKKIGDYYYRLGEYDKALSQYEKIKCDDDKNCFTLYHNVGNTFYYIGKFIDDNKIKLDYYRKSVNTYLKALTIKKDEQTLANYEFVMREIDKILEEEKQKQKNQKEQNQEQDNGKEQNQTGKGDKKEEKEKKGEGEGKKENEEMQMGQKVPTYKLNEQKDYQLSEEEKEQLKKYLEQLKQEEKQNMFLNKPKKEETLESILRGMKNFGNDEVENDW